MNRAVYSAVETPVGEVFAAVTDAGVRFVRPEATAAAFEATYEERYGVRPSPVDELAPAVAGAIATGEPGDTEIDWRGIPLFTQAVLKYTADIPRGSVVTYRDIANAIGRPSAARAVGRSLGANPVPFLVPCHRVVASDSLGGFGLGVDVKQALLQAEGAIGAV